MIDGFYVPDPKLPATVLVDIDGTVALKGDRDPFDWGRVGEDAPNGPVIATVLALHSYGFRIVFMSGRVEECRAQTARWIAENLWSKYEPHPQGHDALLMRANGDYRKDSVVKRELFDAHVRNSYYVLLVLDDRDQVVEMWREIGLTVFQVAPSDF